jgi:hypothetical protein
MSYFKSFSLACAGTMISLAFAVPACSQAVPANVGTPASAGNYSFLIGNGSTAANGVVTTDSTGHATAQIQSLACPPMQVRTTTCTRPEHG